MKEELHPLYVRYLMKSWKSKGVKVEYQDSSEEVNDFKTVLVQESILEATIVTNKKDQISSTVNKESSRF